MKTLTIFVFTLFLVMPLSTFASTDTPTSTEVTCSFSSAQDTVPYDGRTTLTWLTENADSVHISGIGEVGTRGQQVSPRLRLDREIKLIAENATSRKVCTTFVKVDLTRTANCSMEKGECLTQEPQSENGRLVRVRGKLLTKEGRLNSSFTRYTQIGYTNPEDDYYAQGNLVATVHNLASLRSGEDDYYSLLPIQTFVPNKDVKIKRVLVSMTGIPNDLYEFTLGDNCIYTIARNHDTGELHVPRASELYCTGASVWGEDSYTRQISFPDDIGIMVPAEEIITCPVHLSLVGRENELDPERLKDVNISCTFEYEILEENDVAQKTLRIPYLDTFGNTPHLIQHNKPWYKAWDGQTPLQVRGFSLYFGIKASIPQQLKNVCVYAIDEEGNEVGGKKICIDEDELLYSPGETHLQFGRRAFIEGSFAVNPGEYLTASCDLESRAKRADCGIYVLVDVPQEKKSEITTGTLFRSSGAANLRYLRDEYCPHDRHEVRVSPAGLRAVESILTTTISWISRVFSNDPEIADLQACRHLFVD